MQYLQYYDSPLGKLLMVADDEGLTGLWYKEQKHHVPTLDADCEEKSTPVLEDAGKWLDVYFSGKDPGPFRSLHMVGTDFRKAVWEVLLTIPYGKTTTYGEIAKKIGEKTGSGRMSAQAVGGAVGHNRIAIMVPCHRVIGSDGSLTGYAGGVDNKAALLKLEGALTDDMYIPQKGTAL